jgi:hypothetical protein
MTIRNPNDALAADARNLAERICECNHPSVERVEQAVWIIAYRERTNVARELGLAAMTTEEN